MSDFIIPTVDAHAGYERCAELGCGSTRTQAVLDLTKCLDCGATWVTGSSVPAYDGPGGQALLDAALALITNVSGEQSPEWAAASAEWVTWWHGFNRLPMDHSADMTAVSYQEPRVK